ncbi:DUF554 domain-containing protein [Fundidesulfovibrio putealis]|uniref:DUF554 domain-containing protein n=1 Tax=Fundidesulfovibrio putealis TaxID=270496 RepID=UPI0004826095|nr:DUF554 domain-containing protein [Fundidesulfovibrio putealis]
MIGPYVNGATVVAGSLAGAFLGSRMSRNLRERMPMVFGCASLGLGMAMVVKVQSLPPMVLALVLGSIFGELVHLETGIQKLATKARALIEKFAKPSGDLSHDEFLEKFVAIMVLFCVSGTGIFGAMSEGMTGDPTLLIVKAILDLFTSAIFAATLGYTVVTLVVPQFIIQTSLFFGAALIMPLTTPTMVADFSACGGLIMLATGFRICGIKQFPVANMIPSLFMVMPLSALWSRLLG